MRSAAIGTYVMWMWGWDRKKTERPEIDADNLTSSAADLSASTLCEMNDVAMMEAQDMSGILGVGDDDLVGDLAVTFPGGFDFRFESGHPKPPARWEKSTAPGMHLNATVALF